MVAETASRQVPVCVPEQVPVTVNRCVARLVPRTDRRAAVHDGPGRRPDLPVVQLNRSGFPVPDAETGLPISLRCYCNLRRRTAGGRMGPRGRVLLSGIKRPDHLRNPSDRCRSEPVHARA